MYNQTDGGSLLFIKHRRLMLVIVALILAWPWPPPAAAADRAPALVLGAAAEYALKGHLAMLADPDGHQELAEVLSPTAAFTPLAGNLRRGYTPEVTWLHFTLAPSADFPATGFLRFAPAYLDSLVVYLQTGSDPRQSASYQKYQLGDLQPATSRPVLHPHFVVPFAGDNLEEINVYLRIATRTPTDLYGSVHTQAGLVTYTHHNALIHGGYLVATLAIAAINLVYFVRVRDHIFSSYAAFLLMLFTVYLGNSGMIVPLLPEFSHHFSGYLMGMAVGLTFSCIAVFASYLFHTERLHPIFRYCFRYFFVFGVILALSVLAGHYQAVARLMPAHGLLLITLLTALSIYLVKKGEVGARIYLAALLLGNIGYAVSFLQLQGVISLMDHPTHLLQAASLVQMVLMSLGLTERLHAAEAQALDASRRAEQEASRMAWEMTHQYRQKQRELEEALKRENQATEDQSRLVAMLAHEYRTPLAIINTNLDILQTRAKSAGDNQETTPRLDKMKKAVGRLVEVMENALTVMRFTDYLGDIDSRHLELNQQLRQLVEDTRELCSERQIKLTLAAEPLVVAGAEPLLKTMFTNLLENAGKYSPPHSLVEVWLEKSDRQALINIRDQGPGISDRERNHIFSKYYRGEAGSGKSGTGLGLYLAQRIVEQHRGKLYLTNNQPPPGLTVTISLPLVDQPPGKS